LYRLSILTFILFLSTPNKKIQPGVQGWMLEEE